jgi:hypothetical protein
MRQALVRLTPHDVDAFRGKCINKVKGHNGSAISIMLAHEYPLDSAMLDYHSEGESL